MTDADKRLTVAPIRQLESRLFSYHTTPLLYVDFPPTEPNYLFDALACGLDVYKDARRHTAADLFTRLSNTPDGETTA